MAKQHVKKGQEVVIIAGSERGKRGKIIEVIPGKNRVIVEGVKIIKKHTRRNQNNPEGAIIEREGTVHLSNVVSAEQYDARAGKSGATTNS
ncbi:MAG: 50S ribosomal protein L24 [Verrucomicrobiota bacterium]|jgi:large subunit ribosomal protein L24